MNEESEFLKISIQRVAGSCERINHAVRQLRDHQIWQRPSPNSNSIGIILQHLTGNLNQWVLAGVGGKSFLRDRPAEFAAESRANRDQVLHAFNALIEEVKKVLGSIPAENLIAPRRIQGFDETVLSAIYSAVTHLDLHAGQIQYIAKMILQAEYREFWRPANVEQGGSA